MLGMLSDNIRVVRVMDGVVAGTTDQNGSGVDMSQDGGYDGVVFVAMFGVLTANQVTSMRAQASDDDAASDAWSDLLGSATPALDDDDDDLCLQLDIIRPNKKWVRPVIDRATANAVIDGVLAILYRGRSVPTSLDASVAFAEKHVSPIEGTA